MRNLKLILILFSGLAGGLFGLGAYTFLHGEGHSYFVDNPTACANCHAMQTVYDAWHKGSHKAVATCNDCHTPPYFPENLVVKAINGWNHSVAFSMDNYPVPIQITQLNLDVLQQNCLFCHGGLLPARSHGDQYETPDCLRCHAGVGHDH